jgi:hypothetical protein
VRRNFSAHLQFPIEIKRNYHAEVWTAPVSQLDRLYTRDPGASGYGIYVVFWFGKVEGRQMPYPTGGRTLPKSAAEMEAMLKDSILDERRHQIAIVAIDVSGQSA